MEKVEFVVNFEGMRARVQPVVMDDGRYNMVADVVNPDGSIKFHVESNEEGMAYPEEELPKQLFLWQESVRKTCYKMSPTMLAYDLLTR